MPLCKGTQSCSHAIMRGRQRVSAHAPPPHTPAGESTNKAPTGEPGAALLHALVARSLRALRLGSRARARGMGVCSGRRRGAAAAAAPRPWSHFRCRGAEGTAAPASRARGAAGGPRAPKGAGASRPLEPFPPLEPFSPLPLPRPSYFRGGRAGGGGRRVLQPGGAAVRQPRWRRAAARALLGRPPPPRDAPPPPSRTNRTRRVPHPVLIGHAASLRQPPPRDAPHHRLDLARAPGNGSKGPRRARRRQRGRVARVRDPGLAPLLRRQPRNASRGAPRAPRARPAPRAPAPRPAPRPPLPRRPDALRPNHPPLPRRPDALRPNRWEPFAHTGAFRAIRSHRSL